MDNSGCSDILEQMNTTVECLNNCLPDEDGLFTEYVDFNDESQFANPEVGQSLNYPRAIATSPPTISQDSHGFISPLPWVQDWSMPYASAEITTLPKLQTIKKLIRLYFIYFHPTFPIMIEREFHDMVQSNSPSENEPHPKSISLVLLNAIMFVASTVRPSELSSCNQASAEHFAVHGKE
jgi:hypothetical protein